MANQNYAEGACKVSAEEIALTFRKTIQEEVARLPGGVGPKMVGFLANKDPAARKYAEWTGKAMARDSLRFELREVEPHDLEQALEDANRDPEVHGIMIYYPVFGQQPSFHGGSHDDYLRDSVSLCKDAEGLCHFYRRALYRNHRYVDQACTKKCVLPCTPLAVVKVLEHMDVYDSKLPVGDRMRGKTVCIVNRSEIVGRPLAAMLANDGATVYSVDIDSVYVFRRGNLELPPTPRSHSAEAMVRKSDIVILGVPSDNFKMSPAWIKEGAVVINVASHKNIDEQELLTTRPGVRYMGQVGKVTVAMLERNLLRLYQNYVGGDCFSWGSDILLAAESLVAGGSAATEKIGAA
eukprot:gnl/TRDRNA2_/TRDRNA2_177660_c0_seq1.p1 gnl/TRDRNA2_/TRDRNA2_177660_c0~~gnl/TRDRNA2_/TRDRNA2_177660_c0_seq1.p1  ORF type:complete len:351 (+),score=65.10 gnl/TRDRNA2_/TRDRNA2_177660_c0_seq1:83-1135(+)